MSNGYQFITSCVSFPAHDVDSLHAMIKDAKDITYQTFKRKLGAEMLAEIESQFGYGSWLRLQKDWHVSYHASKLKGAPVVFMRHSAIEYIYSQEAIALG